MLVPMSPQRTMPSSAPVRVLARPPADDALFGAARTRTRRAAGAPQLDGPLTLRYQVLSGSHAYGLASVDSDEDWRGFYQLPSAVLLGLDRSPKMTIEQPPDQTYWELVHFARLCLGGNPNIVETLWVDPEFVTVTSPVAQALRQIRAQFISRTMVEAYLGWAKAERKQMAPGADPEAWNPALAGKRGSHLVRLLVGLQGALTHGVLEVTLQGATRDRLLAVKAGQCSAAEVLAQITGLEAECRQLAERRALGPADQRALEGIVLAARRGDL
jgi:hypothetical protein